MKKQKHDSQFTQISESIDFKQSLVFWIKLGFISFGGPAGQISIMHDTLVEKKKWVSEEKFLNALNYCMLLPGPEAQQLATYIGWLLHGVRGGLAAGIFFILPGALLLLLLSNLYVQFNHIPIVTQFFYGLKISVAGIVIVATRNIALKSLKSHRKFAIAIFSLIYMSFLQYPMPYLILFLLVFGFMVPNDSNKQILNHGSIPKKSYKIQFNLKYLVSLFLIFVLLGILPILFFYATGNEVFWNQLILFFTKTALITFGGAYAVLPYVADQAVNNFHWLDSSQMIDGLALGETTPGPLVIVLSFVGFMAGYKIFGGSLILASLSMAIATYYTFLPSFFFIFAGAPFIESLLHWERLKRALEFVSAGIVGLIASLALTIFLSVSIDTKEAVFNWKTIDYYSILWIGITYYALAIRKWNLVLWIVVSSIAGWVYLNVLRLYS